MSGRVLITGGFGNLGSYITKHLATLGYELFILTRKEKNKFHGFPYSVIECDLTDRDALEEKLNIDFDFCIHMASFNEFFLPEYPKKALDINTYGTRNLLEVLSKKNIKNFIYFSTFHVYGKSSGDIDENTSLEPTNDYASTHLFAEYYLKQFFKTDNLQHTILRLTNSYGCPTFIDSDKWYLVLNDLVKSAYENKEIVLKSNGKAKRDFISMKDVSVVVEKLLLKSATNDIYNLSSNQTFEIIELAKLVHNEYQQRFQTNIEIEMNQNDRTIYQELSVKNDKLKNLIDFEVNNLLIDEINKIFDLLELNS